MKIILPFVLLFFCYNSISQEFKVTTIKELQAQINKKVKGMITRDDLLSIELKDLYLNGEGQYMVDITVDFFEEPISGGRILLDSKKLILDKLVQNTSSGLTNFTNSSYKDLFGLTNLEKVSLLKIDIGVTKVDGKENDFKSLQGILGTVTGNEQIVQTVFNVLGINKPNYEQNQRRLISSAEFNVPLNFSEDGIFSNKNNRPYLINNESIGIPFILSIELDNPSNLKRIGIAIVNKVTKWVYGETVLKTDKENVVGGMIMQFSKDKNTNYPEQLIKKIEKLSRIIQRGRYNKESVYNEIDLIEKNISDSYDGQKISTRMMDNLFFYIDLCRNYINCLYLQSGDMSVLNNEFIVEYSKWMNNAYIISTNWDFMKFAVSGIYKGYKTEKRRVETKYIRLAKLYIPYSTTNTLILHSVQMQERIHSYISRYIPASELSKSLELKTESLIIDEIKR